MSAYPTMNNLQQQQQYHAYGMQAQSMIGGMPIPTPETMSQMNSSQDSLMTSPMGFPHSYAIPQPSAQEMMSAYGASPSTSSSQPQNLNFNSITSGMYSGTSATGPIRKRRFSSAKIQPTRIKKVMQSDEDIGRMVASVPVAIGRAMEHFAEKFLLASASAVAGSNGRTLSPYHMKLAMLANPHFAFLEPILREICVPAKQAENIPYNVCQVPSTMPSPTMPGCVPLPATSSMAPQNISSPMISPTTPPVLKPAPVTQRRQSNGQRPDLAPGEKPKRGRPRKMKKEEKLIDDELADVPTETELMPPPMLPPPKMMRSPVKSNLPPNSDSRISPPSFPPQGNRIGGVPEVQNIPRTSPISISSNNQQVTPVPSSIQQSFQPPSAQNENIPNGVDVAGEEKSQ